MRRRRLGCCGGAGGSGGWGAMAMVCSSPGGWIGGAGGLGWRGWLRWWGWGVGVVDGDGGVVVRCWRGVLRWRGSRVGAPPRSGRTRALRGPGNRWWGSRDMARASVPARSWGERRREARCGRGQHPRQHPLGRLARGGALERAPAAGQGEDRRRQRVLVRRRARRGGAGLDQLPAPRSAPTGPSRRAQRAGRAASRSRNRPAPDTRTPTSTRSGASRRRAPHRDGAPSPTRPPHAHSTTTTPPTATARRGAATACSSRARTAPSQCTADNPRSTRSPAPSR